jgi:hypothetical protein
MTIQKTDYTLSDFGRFTAVNAQHPPASTNDACPTVHTIQAFMHVEQLMAAGTARRPHRHGKFPGHSGGNMGADHIKPCALMKHAVAVL